MNTFWSIALYDADGFAVDNPIDRTQLGTYDNLATDPDGTVTIHIQRGTPSPDHPANWLLSPPGSFNLALRLYNRITATLTLDWRPPAVQHAQP